jgi:outer membrane beta-barrel protein
MGIATMSSTPRAGLTLAIAALLGAAPAAAQQSAAPPAAEQVIVPEVARREVRLPRMPSKDFSVGAFVGTYSAQNFGASLVYGLRLGYFLTEDFFVEAAYGSTEVSDDDFRQILPGGIFPQPKQTLSYYNLSLGYNLLPGEVFFGSSVAKASAFYVIAGIGSTRFVEQRPQTLNIGFGMRLLFSDRFALQVDVRDHLYSLDILGRRESTQNLELTAGATYYF